MPQTGTVNANAGQTHLCRTELRDKQLCKPAGTAVENSHILQPCIYKNPAGKKQSGRLQKYRQVTATRVVSPALILNSQVLRHYFNTAKAVFTLPNGALTCTPATA